MDFKKLMLIAAVAGTFGLYGCSEGDESSLVIEGDTSTVTNPPPDDDDDDGDGGGDPGNEVSTCPDWTSARPVDADGNDVCQLPTTISTSRTLTADTVWFLPDVVTVGNGNREMSATQGVLESGAEVLNVRLTIEPGTQIKGATGTFANLTITRGSQIFAEGTADAPIVFSSEDADFTGQSEWGGLIIHGYGDHNECPALPCNVDSEGESGFAGGFGTPDDNSGVLSYVVVTEGGYEFAPGNEINGISMMSVGSGTTMEYIQVNDNGDDGVEMYGGAVNLKYLVLTGNQDDTIDWDEGYQGSIQYVIVKQVAATTGNGIEADTFGNDLFLSKPTLSNVTILANGDETEVAVFKEGSGGFLHNSVLTSDEGYALIEQCVLVDGADAEALVNTALVFNNVIADCPTLGSDTLSQDTVFSVPAALDGNYASQAAEALLDAPIDWAAINEAFPESTADVDFLDPVNFVGAVNPDGSDLWFQGWIVDGSL